MRALKFWTTTMLVFGLMLLMGSPLLLTRKPLPSAAQNERLRFAALMTGYVILLVIVFFIVILLAYRLMVRQREEYREARLTNLKELVEGSLQDHGRAPKDE